MTTLGDEIRAQKTRADTLSVDLAQAATDLRKQIEATDWVSSAASRCRSVLTRFAAELDARSVDATDFGIDIGRHAGAVEACEALMGSVKDTVTSAVTLAVPAVAAASAAPLVSASKAVGHTVESICDSWANDPTPGPFNFSDFGNRGR